MKFIFSTLFLFTLFLTSCNDKDEKRQEENIKDAKKKELIFENINKGWKFSYPQLNPESKAIINNWSEWRLFLDEVNQKPTSSIGAFQKKSKAMSKRVLDLKNNIPEKFNKPEIKSRISVLMSKINEINLFINLSDIPDQKVIASVNDVNIEINSLAQQMNEIVRKSNIPQEEGESDMIRMLDTSRAVPTIKNNKISPK